MSTDLSLTQHPFGHEISEQALIERFALCQAWEDKYRELIKLSRALPPLDAKFRTAEREIFGCENRVWLGWSLLQDGTLHFFGDSEGRIVKGLLAILLTLVEGKTAVELKNAPLLARFNQLGLQNQLSATRQSGLQSLVQAIHQAAQQAERPA